MKSHYPPTICCRRLLNGNYHINYDLLRPRYGRWHPRTRPPRVLQRPSQREARKLPRAARHRQDETPRSQQQSAYLFAAVYPPIAEHTGYSIPELHEVCKQMFLPPRQLSIGGQTVTVAGSTALRTTAEMMEYIVLTTRAPLTRCPFCYQTFTPANADRNASSGLRGGNSKPFGIVMTDLSRSLLHDSDKRPASYFLRFGLSCSLANLQMADSAAGWKNSSTSRRVSRTASVRLARPSIFDRMAPIIDATFSGSPASVMHVAATSAINRLNSSRKSAPGAHSLLGNEEPITRWSIAAAAGNVSKIHGICVSSWPRSRLKCLNTSDFDIASR
jgi:hypothetical protein